MKDGNFYQMREKWNNAHKIVLDSRLFLICDVREAIILSYLIDKYFAKDGKTFKCPAKMLQDFCGTKSTTQKAIIRTLAYKGFIEIGKTKTIPPTRTITVMMEVVNASVEEKQGEGVRPVFGLRNRTNHNPPKTDQLNGQRPITLLFHNKVNKKQSANTERSSSENNNEFISHKNKNKVRHQDVDLARAEALAKGLARRNKIAVAYSTKRWANEFAKLRNIDKIDNEKISFVLDWYIPNIGEKYMPVAYSAKSFRVKFSRLAELAEKTKPIPISPEVASLSRELEQFRSWPKNSKKDVEVSCQVCFDSYQEFFRKLSECKKKINKQNLPNTKKHYRIAVRETIDYLWKSTPSASAFTREWMSRVSDRISKWDKWNGDLRAWAWNGNFNSPDFLKFFMPYIQNYSTSGLRYWNTIKELM